MTVETERNPICSKDETHNQLSNSKCSALKTYTYEELKWTQQVVFKYSYVCAYVSVINTKKTKKKKYETIKIKKPTKRNIVSNFIYFGF